MSESAIHAAYKALLSRGKLTQNPGQAALVARLATLQQTLLRSGEPQLGLYIYGSVGTGKSRLADLFASTLPSKISKRRVHFHEFMMDIHSRLHRARSLPSYSGDPLVQIGQEVRSESRVLCFDEFQVSDIADALILKRIFGAIWNSGGVMVSTSNRHPNKLYEKGLNRTLFIPFIQELQRRSEIWKLEGELDYRMDDSGGQQRESVFYTDREKFESSLRIATNGAPLEELIIPVMMTRQLQVEACVRDPDARIIASTTFTSLCEANLGYLDYYALCKAASTIYLAGLRRFREDELDFIRRFITLIDLAYESKTRVICLSSVPLKEVFQSIVPAQAALGDDIQEKLEQMSVRGQGGSSSSMMSTFIGETEWSATGLQRASLASGGAGETDVKFAIGRAVSRLFEMGWKSYGVRD